MNFLYYSSLLLFLVLALFLTLLVLIQKGRGGGLSAAFGGVGGNTAFGAKTGDVLTWATSIVFGVFLLLAIALNLLANSIHARNMNPYAEKPAVAPATTAPTEASRAVVVPEDARPPETPTPTTVTPAVVPPTSAPAASAPAAAPGGPNPKPTPPPSPTTNPSTKPTAAATQP